MPNNSSKLAEALEKRYLSLEFTRKKIDNLASKGNISRRDAERMYEGLFINAHIAFESFLENLFIGLLIHEGGVESGRPDINPRIEIHSHKVAREVLMGPRSQFINWFPYQKTIELAGIYFRGGRPFSQLGESQKQNLLNCHIIRNAISHRSRYSIRKFEENILRNSSPLPTQERSPAGYLMGLFRTSPFQTRYENIVIQLLLIAKDLAR